MTRLSIVVCISLVMLGLIYSHVGIAEQVCKPTNAGNIARQFDTTREGVVIDKQGLMWMRCALGQQWATGRCVRSHESYTFREAQDYINEYNSRGGAFGFADWRLPTLAELLSIVEPACHAPAANRNVFPEAPVTAFWTSTLDPAYAQGVMLVHFVNGRVYMGNRSVAWSVRLVRER